MQEPRRPRRDVLRRQRRHGGRHAEGPEEAEDAGHAGLHLHARRGSRRLREDLQALHRPPRAVRRQEGRVLPGAVQRGRDRGDALRPPARGRLLHRADRLRRQHRRRGALRHQGLREGLPGLQPDRRGEGIEPVPEALGPEGQEGRAHRAVVQLRPHGADGALPEGRPRAREGLQDPVLRQARPVDPGRGHRRLRRGGRRLRRLPPHGRARPDQGRATSA